MTQDKGNIIYLFLKKIDTKKDISISELGNIEFNSDWDMEIIDYLKENDLIKSNSGKYSSDQIVYIRPNGKEVLKYGSWTEYIDSKNKIIKEAYAKETERQEKQDKKLDIDIYLGEFEKKQGTKFKQFGFVILVVNLFIVLSGIFISNQANKLSEYQKTDLKEQIEKKLDKSVI